MKTALGGFTSPILWYSLLSLPPLLSSSEDWCHCYHRRHCLIDGGEVRQVYRRCWCIFVRAIAQTLLVLRSLDPPNYVVSSCHYNFLSGQLLVCILVRAIARTTLVLRPLDPPNYVVALFVDMSAVQLRFLEWSSSRWGLFCCSLFFALNFSCLFSGFSAVAQRDDLKASLAI